MGNKGLSEERKDKHPSYGMVLINRSQSSGTHLFGSIATHNSFITLQVSRGEVSRHLANDWYHADSLPLIEIEMSHSQFAELITSPGIGSGVPCTIRAFDGKMVERCPAPEPVISKFDEDLKATTNELVTDLKQQIQHLEQALLPGEKGLNKTQLKELLSGIKRSFQTITDSIPYIEKNFHEEMEVQTDKFVGELEAVAGHMIHRLGMQALADKAQAALPSFPAPQLTEGKKK
jgi:hypothetical protein